MSEGARGDGRTRHTVGESERTFDAPAAGRFEFLDQRRRLSAWFLPRPAIGRSRARRGIICGVRGRSAS